MSLTAGVATTLLLTVYDSLCLHCMLHKMQLVKGNHDSANYVKLFY